MDRDSLLLHHILVKLDALFNTINRTTVYSISEFTIRQYECQSAQITAKRLMLCCLDSRGQPINQFPALVKALEKVLISIARVYLLHI